MDFGRRVLTAAVVTNRRVLEVGAYDVNGSLRSIADTLEPSEYVGVDIDPGPGVDQVCDAAELLQHFGPASFDVVISTEMLEHVRDWRGVITNLKEVLRPGGTLVVTTRSLGFPFHEYPSDYWRYELADMREIFSDFEIDRLQADPSEPGVFLLARKARITPAADLSALRLYSMLTGRRTRRLTWFIVQRWRWRQGKETRRGRTHESAISVRGAVAGAASESSRWLRPRVGRRLPLRMKRALKGLLKI